MRNTRKSGGALRSVVTFGALLVALAVLVNVLLAGREAPTPPAFEGATGSLEEAIGLARERERVVFAVASAAWCGPCQSYKRGALADPRVSAWIEDNAVPLSIDVTGGANEAAQRLGVSAIPASFLLDAEGRILARHEGAMSGGTLLGWLRQAAAKATPDAGTD